MTRVVKLEFLRHGPAHNQLLSPLTDYLVVCGDHEAVSVTLPFEHQPVLDDLRRLRATRSRDRADDERALEEMSTKIGEILGGISGLIAELSDNGSSAAVAHLRLVLSAHELALLPFEIAAGSASLPGAGQHLALQATTPICVTREVRSSGVDNVQWPRDARILLAAANLPQLPPVPLDAHLLALRSAVEPWVHADDASVGAFSSSADGADADRTASGNAHLVAPHLEVLPEATPRRLREVIATADPPFTHVHLLAHGALLQGRHGRKRFGVALHADHDPAKLDVVDGKRLVSILRPTSETGELIQCPSVVNLATCDSANIGEVVTSGASLAHELHRAGIPFVVASQFPLSVEGSVHTARLLYPRLLRGEDPRVALFEVRRALHALVPSHHDWASMVVYASLPADLDTQLQDVRFARGRAAIRAAMNHVDRLPMSGDADVLRGLISEHRKAVDRFVAAKQMVETDGFDGSASGAAVHGLLAGAHKRVADALFRLWHALTLQSEVALDELRNAGNASQLDWRTHLDESLKHYTRCFEADERSSWALVQSMVLRCVEPGGRQMRPSIVDTAPFTKDEWELAWLLSTRDVDGPQPQSVWALNNLIELGLLAELYPTRRRKIRFAERGVRDWARLLVERVGVSDLEVRSLRRQLARYEDGLFAHDRVRALAIEVREIVSAGS